MKTINHYLFTLATITMLFISQSILPAQAQNTQNDSSKIYLPEAMTINMDSLLNEWKANNYIYPDTTCALPNVNPDYDTITYVKRLSRIPAVMELPYNDIVRKYIDQYTIKHV